MIALAAVVGCGKDTYLGDWNASPRSAAKPDVPPGQPWGVPASTTQPKDRSANLLDAAPESINAQDKRFVRLAAHLDVLRVEVPMGSISASYKLWDHLDEQTIGADRLVTLKQNGLRAAVGRSEAWEPIKAVIDGIVDRLVYHEAANLNTGVVALELDAGPADQTVFFYRGDGSLVGETFPASRNVLQIVYKIGERDPSELVLKVTPEIRQHHRKLEWTRKGKGYAQVPVYHGRTLHELTVQARLPEGCFLVIGPGQEIQLASVVGRALLTREVEGRRYESILFLTPQIVRHGT